MNLHDGPNADRKLDLELNLGTANEPRVQLSIGVVTYNNSKTQISRLARSIDIAATELSDANIAVNIWTIDCGTTTAWQSHTPYTQLSPQGNLGFGKGMNRLLAAAFSEPKTQWFLCVNPDGVFHADLLKELVESSRQWPQSLLEARQFPEEHPKVYDPQTCETAWASGACLLIPRTIYETIGGFDPNFFLYMEDVDFSWRARAAGFSVRIVPKALFGHAVLNREPNPGVVRFYYESARYLAFKWNEARHQAEFEQILATQFSAQGGELPPLPEAKARPKTHRRPIADFSHDFTFAKARW